MTDFLLTIGHSNHTIDYFIGLLARNQVTLLADVRSVPLSRYNPQFNREALIKSLRAAGIDYLYLGRELGGHPHDPACYWMGRVSYELICRTDLFQRGLTHLCDTLRDHTTAIMCAEKDPLNCHRTHLVSRALSNEGVAVEHILSDGKRVAHELLFQPMLKFGN